MKTDNVYIVQLSYSTKNEYGGNYRKVPTLHYENLKLITVKKEEKIGKAIAKDIKSKKIYLCELPIETGVSFV